MPEVAARRALVPFALLLPAWMVLGVFFLVPLLLVFGISFTERGPFGEIQPVEDLWDHVRSGAFLGNYAKSLDSLYWRIYWRSLWIAVLTTVLCLLVSYPIAYYIAILARPRWKSLLLALVVIPFWTSFLIRTYAWMLILRTEGLINTVLLGLGITGEPLDLLYNELAVMIGLVYGELPFMILPLYASLEKLDRQLLEASADLGAGPFSTFRRVTLPQTLPGILAGVVLVFIPSIGQFIVPDLLGGARTMMLGNLIQNQFTVARDQPFGSALAFELAFLVLVVLFIYAYQARKRGQEVLI